MQNTEVFHQSIHFKRPRLNKLFTEAKKYPLVLVCAGAGYGKTSAVYDFIQEYNAITARMQLSQRDNTRVRFWKNFTHTIAQVNLPLANSLVKLGFPHTKEKKNQYIVLMNEMVKLKQRVFVIDDFHFIENASVIRFIEECILFKMPVGTSVFILSRSIPPINTAGMVYRNMIVNISENELRFSEDELAQYLHSLNIFPKPEQLNEIMQDIGGWAFAINLIARSYKKAPGYKGYLRSAVKTNIFQLMETEIWEEISERLKIFLIRLSLIDHFSADLINLLAGTDKDLIAELEKQNAYIRYDSYINAYLIHPLFLEFLSERQKYISEKQKRKTYLIAGNWCDNNGFKIDALSYYEKIEDYKSIVSVLDSLPPQTPHDIAKYASEILDRASKESFLTVEHLAVMHISAYMCQGMLEKSIELAKHYETIFLRKPKKDHFRNSSLGEIYLYLGYLHTLMCITDECYDFDIYFEKYFKYSPASVTAKKICNFFPGPWIIAAGSSKKGSPEKYIAALNRITSVVMNNSGRKTGIDNLALGELKYYQNDLYSAQTMISRALEQAQEYKQYEIMYLALFYLLRIGIAQGNYPKAKRAILEMKSRLNHDEYTRLFLNYDITLCWCYCTIGQPEKTPGWLKENFSPYSHTAFIDNFGNQMKALYCYKTGNYPPLLSHIQEMRTRGSFLFERIEMFAMEACVYYKLKNKKKAFSSLREAYKTACPNEIIIPFVELGKDMRTLTSSALKDSGCKIPKSWLEYVNHKAAAYAKNQIKIINDYRFSNNVPKTIYLSAREREILKDLSHGLTRAEIALGQNLSVNTVKTVINNIYIKLGAENIADAIRIAVQRKII